MADDEKLHGKNPVPRLAGRYIKWTAYGLLILLFSTPQPTPRLIPLTVCIAMYAGPVGGAAAGIAGGFLWDLYSDRLLGFNALLLLAVGCACGLLVRLLLRNNLLSALLLVGGALLFQGLADWFFTVFPGSRPADLRAGDRRDASAAPQGINRPPNLIRSGRPGRSIRRETEAPFMDYNNKQNKLSRRRVLALVTVIVVVFSLYGFRLFQIQIVEGEAYAEIVNRGTSVTMSVFVLWRRTAPAFPFCSIITIFPGAPQKSNAASRTLSFWA